MTDVVPMTAEEFRESMQELAEDIRNPESDFNDLVRKAEDGIRELAEHDPLLALKAAAIVRAVKDAAAYIREQHEANAPATP